MFESLILGAGPGGMGPLIWAAQNGTLASWLEEGVGILDRGASMGGTLGRYVINSDSFGAAYLECLDAPAARELDRKSTRLNSSHTVISYAVFCLKKKKKENYR